MRQLIVSIALIVVASCFERTNGDTARISSGLTCMPPDNASLFAVRHVMRDPAFQRMRDSLRLPTLPDSMIRPIADAIVCTAALAAVQRVHGSGTLSIASVQVYAVGTDHFVVRSPEVSIGHWGAAMFFTREWEFVTDVTM